LRQSRCVFVLAIIAAGAQTPSGRFGLFGPLILGSDAARRLPAILSRLGIAGGAVYDALVALAAAEHGARLATRDARAKPTYETVGVPVIVVAG
jgi:hypothetical protein